MAEDLFDDAIGSSNQKHGNPQDRSTVDEVGKNAANSGEIDSGPGLWTLFSLGSSIVGATVGGLVLGLILDDMLKSFPIATFVGLMVGIVAAVAVTWAQIRKFL